MLLPSQNPQKKHTHEQCPVHSMACARTGGLLSKWYSVSPTKHFPMDRRISRPLSSDNRMVMSRMDFLRESSDCNVKGGGANTDGLYLSGGTYGFKSNPVNACTTHIATSMNQQVRSHIVKVTSGGTLRVNCAHQRQSIPAHLLQCVGLVDVCGKAVQHPSTAWNKGIRIAISMCNYHRGRRCAKDHTQRHSTLVNVSVPLEPGPPSCAVCNFPMARTTSWTTMSSRTCDAHNTDPHARADRPTRLQNGNLAARQKLLELRALVSAQHLLPCHAANLPAPAYQALRGCSRQQHQPPTRQRTRPPDHICQPCSPPTARNERGAQGRQMQHETLQCNTKHVAIVADHDSGHIGQLYPRGDGHTDALIH